MSLQKDLPNIAYTLSGSNGLGNVYAMIFYVVTLRRGRTHTHPRPREQLLLQNYKA